MLVFDDIHVFLWNHPRENNCNTYFIDGQKKIIIDPGHHHLLSHVRDNLAALSVSFDDVDMVMITHGHPDHLDGVRTFNGTPTLTAIHKLEWEFLKQQTHYGASNQLMDFEPDILLQDGELAVGDHVFKVIHTPGHSPGSFCLYWPDRKALFSGDVVFNQGVGRTDLTGGDGQALKESIRSISNLEVEHLLPGHGPTLSGRDLVKSNFSDIERVWFEYM
jgi:hydroxyacylglutathione hydrolase